MTPSRLLPLHWTRGYDGATLGANLLAAAIVTVMLIPQNLAYAMLADLPPEVGLYAPILPLVAYGTSRVLAVGPVAVVSLMTASAIGPVVAQGLASPPVAAAGLALLSGAMLVAAGLFRLGFLANFLSHPVILGFITASGILIAAGQVRHVLGIEVAGTTLVEILPALAGQIGRTNPWTLAIGLGALTFLGGGAALGAAGPDGRGPARLAGRHAGPRGTHPCHRRLDPAGQGAGPGRARRQAGRRDPASVAKTRPARAGPRAAAGAGPGGAADLGRGLRRVGLGRADPGGAAARAHRAGPGTDRARRRQYRRRADRRLPGDRRLRALGGEP